LFTPRSAHRGPAPFRPAAEHRRPSMRAIKSRPARRTGSVMITQAKNSLLGAAAGVSIMLGSFLTGVIVARSLGVSGAGAFAYAVWIVLTLAPIIDIGFSAAVSRYVPELRGRGELVESEKLARSLLRRLAASVLFAVLIIMMVACAVLLLRPQWVFQEGSSSAHSQSFLLLGLIVLCLVFQVFGSYAYSFLRGAQDFRQVAHLAVVSLIVKITGVGIGSVFFGLPGALAGYAAGQLVPSVAACRLMGKSGHPDRELTARVARYAKFAWAANVANALVWSRTELFFLERYWGYEAVAMFAVALAVSTLAGQGPALLTTGVLSVLSERRGRNELAALREAYETGTRVLAAIVFPVSFGMVAIMPVLLPLIYGNAFAPAVPATIALVIVASLSVPSAMATNLVQAFERSDFIFASAALGAVFAILAGFLLVPAFGLFGAVTARVAIHILMTGATVWFVTRRLGYRLPYDSLIRLMAAAITSAIAAAVCVSVIGGTLSLVVAVPAAVVVYMIALRVLRAASPDDLAQLTELARAIPPRWAAATIAMIDFLRPASQSLVRRVPSSSNVRESQRRRTW
jgi:O-antigen/teichoic acid export membrane protein